MFTSPPVIFNVLGLAILLLLLYLFHRQIVKYFSAISFLIFGRSSIGVYAYFLFFLPGVILHELAHLFTASFLGVPTGNLTIFPHKEKEDWTLGKVSSAETDLLRASLIGLAPIFVGTASLVVLVKFGLGINELSQVTQLSPTWINLVLFYLMLTFTNTMFLSKEDRSTIWALPSLLVILFFLGQAMGWVGVLSAAGNLFLEIATPLTISLTLTVLVDFVFILPLIFLTRLLVSLRG